jgi:hypothetical protein
MLDRLHVGERSRLRTSRGITASVVTACVVVFGAAGSKSPGAALFALITLSPLIWWFCWWALGAFRTIGNALMRGRPPQVKVGRAWQGSSSARQQLRQDGNADTFTDRGGILLRKRR